MFKRVWVLVFVPFAFCHLPCRLVFAEGPSAQHFHAGLAYERLGRLDESYTELQLAFALDQSNTDLATALGLVASRLGRLEVAERALERSVTLDSNSIASYFQLGFLYEKLGKVDRAQDAWRRFYSLSQDEPLKALAQRHLQHLDGHAE